MNRHHWASYIPLVTAGVVLALQGTTVAVAQERGCAGNSASCDFQEKSTTLRAQIWSGVCDLAEWDRLPSEGFPIAKETSSDGRLVETLQQSVRAPVHLLNGVCELHRAGGDTDRGIAELQKAAGGEMLQAQRQAASLFEGLLHCRKLEELKGEYGSEVTARPSSRDAFCMHRAMAKASFTRVRWAGLDMSYDAPEFSLTGHAESMAACYASSLHAGYDAACGVVATPSAGAIDAAAETVSRDILADYFGTATADAPPGGTAIPPLKAMLARKLEMADASLAESTALLGGLQQKSDLLTTSERTLASMFCLAGDASTGLCSGPLPNAVSGLHQGYERAVLRTQALLDFIDGWVNGIYEHNGKDVRKELKKSDDALKDMLSRAERPAVPNEMTLLEKLDFIKGDMAQLTDLGTADAALMRRECSVYFCEIRNRNRTFFTRACDQIDATLGRKVRDVNTLCSATASGTTIAGTETAATLCQRAGLSAARVSGAAMTAREVDTCMAELHP